MKVLLAIGTLIAASNSVFAADMIIQPPPSQVVPLLYAPPSIYDWSGCYMGVEGGPVWGKSSQTAASGSDVGLPITNSFGVTGALLGGTIGCNYQVANFVLGAEGDSSWSNATGTVGDQPPFAPHGITSTDENSFSTLRGRVGFAWDRLFFYEDGHHP